MANPQFTIGDVVYLSESAKVGSLESYKIISLRQTPCGNWKYMISVPILPPTITGTMGDRVTRKQPIGFELEESVLCNLCTAVSLAEAYHTSQLSTISQIKSTYCK